MQIEPLNKHSNDGSYSPAYRRYILGVLLVASILAMVDRSLISTLGEAIKVELKLSDTQLGLLSGLGFTLLYSVVAIPIARLAEHKSRTMIMSLAVFFWSAMTALCGMAQSYLHLFLARAGVGVGEAGSVAGQTLVADLYPPDRRGFALGVLALGVPIGMLVGAISSGWIAEQFSWRTAFLVVGIPGMLLAPVIYFTLREPRRGLSDSIAVPEGDPPTLIEVVKLLADSRPFRFIILGMTLYSIASMSVMGFLHPFFVRQHGFGYTAAAAAYAGILGITPTIALIIGGWLTDHFGPRNARNYLRIPAIGSFFAAPLFMAGFMADGWIAAIALMVVGCMAGSFYLPPLNTVIFGLAGPHMRASVITLVGLGPSLIAGTAGPALIGIISDAAARRVFVGGDFVALCPGGHALAGAAADIGAACREASASGLQAAITMGCVFFLLASISFYMASRLLGSRIVALDGSTGPDASPAQTVAGTLPLGGIGDALGTNVT